jgi:hypothetical protein
MARSLPDPWILAISFGSCWRSVCRSGGPISPLVNGMLCSFTSFGFWVWVSRCMGKGVQLLVWLSSRTQGTSRCLGQRKGKVLGHLRPRTWDLPGGWHLYPSPSLDISHRNLNLDLIAHPNRVKLDPGGAELGHLILGSRPRRIRGAWGTSPCGSSRCAGASRPPVTFVIRRAGGTSPGLGSTWRCVQDPIDQS